MLQFASQTDQAANKVGAELESLPSAKVWL
jgi:hypothetical protein